MQTILLILLAYLVATLIIIQVRRRRRKAKENRIARERLKRIERTQSRAAALRDRKTLAEDMKEDHPTANRRERRQAAKIVQKRIRREIRQKALT